MKFAKFTVSVVAAAATALLSSSAFSGGYGKTPYGMPYSPVPGMGMPYGAPMPMMPSRPLPPARPTRPERPMMRSPYGYGGMAKPTMPGTYRSAPNNYGAAMAAAPVATAQAAEPSEAASVSISQMRFDAPTVTVKVGGTVTWTNGEVMPHTVTADDGSFDSVQLGAGDTFIHTFTEAGTYSYYCKLHPMMRATVVVVG